MGFEPVALLRLNISQFLAVVNGYRERKATEENHFRKLYYLLYSVYRDPKKITLPPHQIWPIPEMDYFITPEEVEEMDLKKIELMKLWGISEN